MPTLSPRVQVSPNPPRVQPRHLREVEKIFTPRVQAPTFPPRVQVQIHSPRMQSSPRLPQRPSPVIQPHFMHVQSPTFQHGRKTFFNNRHSFDFRTNDGFRAGMSNSYNMRPNMTQLPSLKDYTYPNMQMPYQQTAPTYNNPFCSQQNHFSN